MDDEDRYTRITLRIPKDLHRSLSDAADRTSKSLNAEIIERLQRSFDEERAAGARDGVEAAVMGIQTMLAFHLRHFFDLLPETERAKPINQVVRNLAAAIGHGTSEQIHESLLTYFKAKESTGIDRIATTLHSRRKLLDSFVDQGEQNAEADAETLGYLRGEPKP